MEQDAVCYADLNVGIQTLVPSQEGTGYVDLNVGLLTTPEPAAIFYIDLNVIEKLLQATYLKTRLPGEVVEYPLLLTDSGGNPYHVVMYYKSGTDIIPINLRDISGSPWA